MVFCGHKEFMKTVDISHDGKYILSTSNDKTCKLWSLKKPNELLFDIPKQLTDTKTTNSPQLTPSKDVNQY